MLYHGEVFLLSVLQQVRQPRRLLRPQQLQEHHRSSWPLRFMLIDSKCGSGFLQYLLESVSGCLKPNHKGKIFLDEWEETIAYRDVSAWYKCYKSMQVSAQKKFWLLCCSLGLRSCQINSKFWIWLLQGTASWGPGLMFALFPGSSVRCLCLICSLTEN